MKQAVAGHKGQDNRETFVSGADVPSSLSGTATGPRPLTQASFAFKCPCDTCPQRDDCGARCAEYWNWFYR